MHKHYKECIEQAFINSIRSVVIVDDDYPTIEEILENARATAADEEVEPGRKSWSTNPTPIQRVISEFRSDEKKYILDIHDAQSLTEDDEMKGAAHLHQTDLLILDYQLNPDDDDDWGRSLKIARTLMSNTHFNLIIVNTNKELDDVFQNYLLGILRPFLKDLTDSENSRVEEAYDAIQEMDDFGDRLNDAFGFHQYCEVRKNEKVLRNIGQKTGNFVRAKTLFEDAELEKKYWPIMARSALIAFEKRNVADNIMSPLDLGAIQFNYERDVKWIRSDKAFITFSDKKNDGPLLACLRAALEDWKPKPSRLVLAKMLADIDEHGVEMQDAALGENYSSALWYQDILNSDSNQLKTKVDETVQHHVEGMLARLMPEVRNFTEALAQKEQKETECANIEVVQKHYGVDLSNDAERKKAQLFHNVLACSQEPHGWHVETGHIFELDKALWVCVSPLCDTVPNQISASQRKTQGNRLRFNALKLHKFPKNKLPDDVQSNRYVFLRSAENINVYSITENADAMPDLGVFWAADAGVFASGKQLSVSRAEESRQTKVLCMQDYETVVVGHLRYEYALNLIQRLGGALTRIGLDYAG